VRGLPRSQEPDAGQHALLQVGVGEEMQRNGPGMLVRLTSRCSSVVTARRRRRSIW
jgi:hypothetical protein